MVIRGITKVYEVFGRGMIFVWLRGKQIIIHE